MDAILVPGGFGKRGVEGKIAGDPPTRASTAFLISASASACSLPSSNTRGTWPASTDANSTEFDAGDAASGGRAHHRMAEPRRLDREAQRRIPIMGGTMRLGAQPCEVVPGSLAHRIYGATTVSERHRHRYEVNNHYLPRIEAAGLAVGARAKSADGRRPGAR